MNTSSAVNPSVIQTLQHGITTGNIAYIIYAIILAIVSACLKYLHSNKDNIRTYYVSKSEHRQRRREERNVRRRKPAKKKRAKSCTRTETSTPSDADFESKSSTESYADAVSVNTVELESMDRDTVDTVDTGDTVDEDGYRK